MSALARHDDGAGREETAHSLAKDGGCPPAAPYSATTHEGGTAVDVVQYDADAPPRPIGDPRPVSVSSRSAQQRSGPSLQSRAGTGASSLDSRSSRSSSSSSSTASGWSSVSSSSSGSWPDDEYLPPPPPPPRNVNGTGQGQGSGNKQASASSAAAAARHCGQVKASKVPHPSGDRSRGQELILERPQRVFESLYAAPEPPSASASARPARANNTDTETKRKLVVGVVQQQQQHLQQASKAVRARRGGGRLGRRFQPPSKSLLRTSKRQQVLQVVPPRPQQPHHLPRLAPSSAVLDTTRPSAVGTSHRPAASGPGSPSSGTSRNLFVVPPASTPSAAALASAVASASASASVPAAAFPSPTEHPRVVHFDLPANSNGTSDVVPFRVVQDKRKQQKQQTSLTHPRQAREDLDDCPPSLSLTSSSGSSGHTSRSSSHTSSAVRVVDFGTPPPPTATSSTSTGIGSTVGIGIVGGIGSGGIGRNSNKAGAADCSTLPIQEPTRKAREAFATLCVDELDEPFPRGRLPSSQQEDGQQLTRLENVTNQQRALIDPDLLLADTTANTSSNRRSGRRTPRRKKMPAAPAPQSSSRRSSSVSAKARNLLRKSTPSDTANGEASSAVASPPRKMKLTKGLGKKSGRSAKKGPKEQQQAGSSPEPAISLLLGSPPGGLEQPALVEDRTDAPPLQMRAGNDGGSKSGQKLKHRKDALLPESDGMAASGAEPVGPVPAPVQQLRVAEEAASNGATTSRGRDASPVTTDYGEESAMPEMETPVKSNCGRPTISSRVRSMSRSISRSRRAKKSDATHEGESSQHAGAEDDEDVASVTSSMSSSSSVMSYGQNLRRSLSRSRSARSSSGASTLLSEAEEAAHRPLLVAVTSCRSDAYHHQKAPGTTSKLPRKAPSALKMFHELAVGLKDAYDAVGATPTNPSDEDEGSDDPAEIKEAKQTLWDFVGNLDFLLGLVDEVAIDTATRGALKDDSAFKSLRDVIKKCNKILETMLVRRERKYTLFFRLVQPHDLKEIKKIKSWNSKVEKAVNSVAETKAETDEPESDQTGSDDESEAASTMSGVSSVSRSSRSSSRGSGVFRRRGRSLLPAAGKVRARRATPAPRLRNRHSTDSDASQSTDASADGFAINTAVTPGNLAKLQQSYSDRDSTPLPSMGTPLQQNKAQSQEVKPKDELVDVIRGLKAEKESRAKGAITGGLPSDLKPNWAPKADIPSSVPKLPIEYIHRHRLMKQVVNCLLDRGTGPRDTDDVEDIPEPIITTITSRHSDKAGNGKTTLAVAAIQTVEVRERFSDGIAWIQLGRAPLTEKDVRRLYEEIHDQLMKEGEFENDSNNGGVDDSSFSASSKTSSLTGSLRNGETDNMSLDNSLLADKLAKSRRRFQGGELEGIKEDLGRMLAKRKVLICLDDVWRVEDAKWFIFDPKQGGNDQGASRVDDLAQEPYRVLITTRVSSLLSPAVAQEVFVRIFSEHEAVKLLLFAAGRRMYGGKGSPVFQQARVIVKGCGNSPLAVRVAGGMLRTSNRNWTLRSPTWIALLSQCKTSLEEASKIRSFQHSVGRIVDLSFVTVQDLLVRTALRRCFVAFAMSFSDNEWVKVGKGIPKPVVLKLFGAVEEGIGDAVVKAPPESLLAMLETMNLLEKARHGAKARSSTSEEDDSKDDNDDDEDADAYGDSETQKAPSNSSLETPCYVMHESIRHLAEDMAIRPSSSFIPSIDDYTSFSAEIEREMKSQDGLGAGWSAPLRSAAKYLAQTLMQKKEGMEEYQFHRLVISSLIGVSSTKSRIPSVAAALQGNKDLLEALAEGDRVESYIAAHMPNHLIRAKMLGMAGELLSDESYISRRVAALGTVEATRRQVVDLVELRREVTKLASENKAAAASGAEPKTPDPRPSTPSNAGGGDASPDSPLVSPSTEPGFVEEMDLSAPLFVEKNDVDIGAVQRDASRRIIDEVYRVVDRSNNSGDSLNMAICLSTVGEGLIKSRQPREAMLRLEEAVGIYRGILGPYHIDVARALNSVAKALSRLSESRVALLKFAEASRIFEACNATRHFDSIANSQSMASLLVDVGDWSKAEAKYEDVISLRKAVYGETSLQAAKTINDYAVVLAKHSRMDKALHQYEAAKHIYEELMSDETALSLTAQMDGKDASSKRGFDLSLINLNIASIKSKKGDATGATECYEKGVKGLQKYLREQQANATEEGSNNSRINSTKRHLVSAMGRIGSLKLKQGDHAGALKAYTGLLGLVDADSPLPSRTEKAKALVKCATIYRQRDTTEDNELAISHLREALEMYTNIHGQNHKDTRAIEASLKQWQAQSTKGGEQAI